MSCPSCGESLGGSERCPGCGAMVAPVVHGALAPDSRTLPARAGRGASGDSWPAPAREELAGRGARPRAQAQEEAGRRTRASPVRVGARGDRGARRRRPRRPRLRRSPSRGPSRAPVVAQREWVAPAAEERRRPSKAGSWTASIRSTAWPTFPCGRRMVPEAPPSSARDLVAEFEAPPREFEASPEGSAEQLERGLRVTRGLFENSRRLPRERRDLRGRGLERRCPPRAAARTAASPRATRGRWRGQRRRWSGRRRRRSTWS